jgi:pyridoxine 4-dehydrogenase
VNPTFSIGGELEVRRLGFGAMRIVGDRAEGARVVRRAVELGVTLIDTADIYGAGVSEEVIADALHPYPEGLVITTKGGLGYGLQDRLRDARPSGCARRARRACGA